jgi:RNA polymerase sigma factor (sigma-70 family)
MVQFSDEHIIEGIVNNDRLVLKYLYNTQFGRIRKYIMHKGGDTYIIKDIFQEALLIIYTKIRNKDLHLTCSFSTYFFAVCKNLWFHELRLRNKITTGINSSEDLVEDPEPVQEMLPELKELVEYHFNTLSEDCKKVLELHFKHKSLTDICEIMGYKDVKYAADRKYRCKQYLFNRIINDPKYKKIKDGLY